MSKIGSYTKIHTNRREHSVIDGDTLEELMDKIKEQADKLRKKVGLKALTESAPGKEATPLTSFDNDKNIPIMRRVRTVIAK